LIHAKYIIFTDKRGVNASFKMIDMKERGRDRFNQWMLTNQDLEK